MRGRMHKKELVIRQNTDNNSVLREDLIIKGVWIPQGNASLDTRATETEDKSYNNRNTQHSLKGSADEKRQKQLEPLQPKHISFTHLIFGNDA